MVDKVKISVVIPVFNAEKYIEKCVFSLFSQTLDSIEYVFVDDCSTDCSIQLIKNQLEKFPKRKDQVVFLKTPQNSGQGLARKIGMQSSTGEYIIHCDSDDWVEPRMYEEMYSKTINGTIDIVVCDFISESEKSSVIKKVKYISDNPQEIIQCSYMHGFHGVLWNKLIRRSIFVDNNIFPYEGINIGEDFALIVRAFVFANSLIKVDIPLYHYNISNVNSTTNRFKFTDAVCIQSIKKAKLLRDDFEKLTNYDLYKKFIMCHCYRSKIHIIRDKISDIKWFKSEFIESDKYARFISLRSLSKPNALRLFLVRNHMPIIQILLFNIYNFFLRNKS